MQNANATPTSSSKHSLDQLAIAIAGYDDAITILRGLLSQEGARDAAPQLAAAIMQKSYALQSLGRLKDSQSTAGEAIALFRTLITSQGRTELRNDLAIALFNRALSHGKLLQLPEAQQDALEAQQIWSTLVSEGQPNFERDRQDASALLNRLALI